MQQTNKGAATYRRLLGISKKYWPAFLIGIISTVLLSFSDAAFAWLIKPIVNEGFINRNVIFIRYLPIAIVILFVVRSIAGFCSSYFISRVARSVVMDFRKTLFRHLLKLPTSYYDVQPSGKLLSTLIYNVEQVAQASSDVLITCLRETSLVIGLVFVMFTVNWRLSLIFLLITPVIIWGIKICSTRLRYLSSRVQTSVAEVSHIMNEGIEANKVIRLYGGYDYEIKKFDRAVKENRHQELKIEVTNSMGTAIIQLLISIPLAIILYVATAPSLGVSAGSFATIISAMIMLVRPMRRVTSLNNFIQKGIAGAESIFELLDEKAEEDHGTLTLPRVQGKMTFNQVSFSYRSAVRPALKNISFEVKPGQTVAIVGHSGGGKSTLISLLPRFYEIESGEITIDDIDIRKFRLHDLRQQFALVSQHTVLFNDSIAHNIAYVSGEQVDYDRLLLAAKSANAYEFIEKLPRGFDTVVGEDGLLFSGGQRQRIAIARALYKQAPILILDEATSALDTHAERQIQTALDELMSRCTTLVIAHRLSTIENADWILVMEQGSIVEKGKHTELLAQNGVYAELYRMQFNKVKSSVPT